MPHTLTTPWATIIIANKQDYGRLDLSAIMNSSTKLYLVSDGSLVEQRGGYVAVLATDEEYISKVYGATPNVGDLNTSIRTEAFGMLSGITMLSKIRAESHLNSLQRQ